MNARPPAAAADPSILEVRRTIAIPRAAAFRAWIEPESVRRWFSTADAPVRTVTIEGRVGGRFAIECDYRGGTWRLDGVIHELAPPRRLVFTWVTTDCPAKVGSLVTVDFAERAGGTEIVLTQSGFPSDAKRQDNDAGWRELLAQLAEVAAGTLRE